MSEDSGYLPEDQLSENTPENTSENTLEGTAGVASIAPNYDDLLCKLEEAELLVKKSEEQVLRFRAEADNIRKRADQDVLKAHKYALERFLLALLPVLDSLEKGLEASEPGSADGAESSALAMQKGIQLTFKLFQEVLKKFNVECIAPQKGQAFDHGVHEAVMAVASSDFPEGAICDVVQRGYRLEDRLLRPARVIVAKTTENEVTR